MGQLQLTKAYIAMQDTFVLVHDIKNGLRACFASMSKVILANLALASSNRIDLDSPFSKSLLLHIEKLWKCKSTSWWIKAHFASTHCKAQKIHAQAVGNLYPSGFNCLSINCYKYLLSIVLATACV